ncbi:MAG: response regulator [Rivularia sp. ALOHA_DT_140]|nr:response regulator [Rivularia sp. ALOHA_DT_140]
MVYSGYIQHRRVNCISKLFATNLSNYFNFKKRIPLVSKESVVLIVDSNDDNLLLTEQIVQLLGYRTITIKDGESALKMIEKYQPDLILLEVMLPKIDGISVAKCLRENNNLVPIIILTSLSDNKFREKALMAGCNRYIEKPFKL